MKPGTKPKPTHLKLVTGNPGKRTLNRKEAKAKAAIPFPPVHLTADAVEEWNRVATDLYNLGVLSEIDRAALAAYAQAYGRWVQAERAIAKMAEKDQLTGGLMITMTIQMGLDTDDTGQILLKSASISYADHSFLVTTQNGDKYYFQAQVMSFKVNVGSVDQITTATVTLELTTNSAGVGVVEVLAP